MLIGGRRTIRVQCAVDEDQLGDRLFAKRRSRIVFGLALIALPIDLRERCQRGVLPILGTRGRPSEEVEAIGGLLANASDTLRLAVEMNRRNHGAIFENAAHEAVTSSCSIHS